MAEASLRRFQPSQSNPWNRLKAAHLLNRAGFGGTPEEIRRMASMRFEAAVEHVLNYEQIQDTAFQEVDFSELRRMYAELIQLRRSRAGEQTIRRLAQQTNRANRLKFQELRVNWIRRMVQTKRPLQEKLALFWHGHLVSGLPETRVAEHMAL
ncbi:MAG TPA: DUF1800 family protein, partial [bacterium]|nr:DUF1800 family protein [bacterium]